MLVQRFPSGNHASAKRMIKGFTLAWSPLGDNDGNPLKDNQAFCACIIVNDAPANKNYVFVRQRVTMFRNLAFTAACNSFMKKV